MLLFKSCPKCKGDVQLATDHDGDYVQCLMCGLSRYLPSAAERATADRQPVRLPKAG